MPPSRSVAVDTLVRQSFVLVLAVGGAGLFGCAPSGEGSARSGRTGTPRGVEAPRDSSATAAGPSAGTATTGAGVRAPDPAAGASGPAAAPAGPTAEEPPAPWIPSRVSLATTFRDGWVAVPDDWLTPAARDWVRSTCKAKRPVLEDWEVPLPPEHQASSRLPPGTRMWVYAPAGVVVAGVDRLAVRAAYWTQEGCDGTFAALRPAPGLESGLAATWEGGQVFGTHREVTVGFRSIEPVPALAGVPKAVDEWVRGPALVSARRAAKQYYPVLADAFQGLADNDPYAEGKPIRLTISSWQTGDLHTPWVGSVGWSGTEGGFSDVPFYQVGTKGGSGPVTTNPSSKACGAGKVIGVYDLDRDGWFEVHLSYWIPEAPAIDELCEWTGTRFAPFVHSPPRQPSPVPPPAPAR